MAGLTGAPWGTMVPMPTAVFVHPRPDARRLESARGAVGVDR